MAGRPSYTPTDKDRATVRAMVAYGVPLEEIADVIGVTRKTLGKHFKTEIRTAKNQANAKVAESLFKEATGGKGSPKVTAAIFWLKTQAGWKETQHHEHTGLDGEPIQTITRTIIDPKDAR